MNERGLLYAIIIACCFATFAIIALSELWQYAKRKKKRHHNPYSSSVDNAALIGFVLVVGFLFTLAIPSTYVGSYASGQAIDTELWGGVVTAKERNQVHCEHDYCCSYRTVCTTDSKGRRSCEQVCNGTCYDHPFDIDWDVKSTLGTFTIHRLSRQGLEEPPRWTSVVVGEPVAETHSYYNWIKAAKFSLLHKDSENGLIGAIATPPYPIDVYDYWHVDRFVTAGINLPDVTEWNKSIMRVNGVVGPAKQASVLVVLTNKADRNWANQLVDAWRGGTKNDVVVVVGAPEYPKIAWAEVFAMSQQSIFQVSLRQAIEEMPTLDRETFLKTVQEHVVKDFVRQHMHNYAYLEDTINPPISTVMWILGVQSLLILGIYGFVRYKAAK